MLFHKAGHRTRSTAQADRFAFGGVGRKPAMLCRWSGNGVGGQHSTGWRWNIGATVAILGWPRVRGGCMLHKNRLEHDAVCPRRQVATWTLATSGGVERFAWWCRVICMGGGVGFGPGAPRPVKARRVPGHGNCSFPRLVLWCGVVVRVA